MHNAIDTAVTTGDLQTAVRDLNDVRAQNNMLPVTDDTLRYFIGRLTNAGVDQDTAVKASVKAQTNRTKRQLTAGQLGTLLEGGFTQADIDAMTSEQRKDALAATRESKKQRPKLKEDIVPTEEAVAEEEALSEREKGRLAATEPTDEEAATIAAKFGEDVDVQKGFSIVTADKVSRGRTDSVETQPVAEVVDDAAVAAINDPRVVETFNALPDKGDRNLHKDVSNFVNLVEEFGSLKDVDPQEAADYLNQQLEVTSVEAGDVADFLKQPHVKVMADNLDRILTNMRRTSEAPIPPMPLTLREDLTEFARVKYSPEYESQGTREQKPQTRVIGGKTYYKSADGVWEPGTGKSETVGIEPLKQKLDPSDERAIKTLNHHVTYGDQGALEAFKFNTKESKNPLIQDLQTLSTIDKFTFDRVLSQHGVSIEQLPTAEAPGERVGAGKGFFFALPPFEEFQQRLKGLIPKSGLVPVDLFQKKGGLRQGQPLSKGEMDLYRQLVPEAFKGNAVHVEKLVNGLREKGPTVETVKLSDRET